MQLSSVNLQTVGPLRFPFARSLQICAFFAITLLILAGCKAESNLTITLQDKSSGTVNFTLELDEPAASVVRSDSYSTKELVNVFNTKELENSGFKVNVTDNKNGDPSLIELRAKFENKNQLKNILAFLAPGDVLDVELISNGSFIKDNQYLEVEIDISRLREHYLDSEDVKKAIEESGIEFSEFQQIIDDAMKSTTLELRLVSESKTTSAKFSGDRTSKETLRLTNTPVRTRYLVNIALAAVFVISGVVLFWRIRRIPKLVSTKSRETEK